MIYVALLRGINVGGNRKVDMKTLKKCYEDVGMNTVRTYINSGNVIFQSDDRDIADLSQTLEQAIQTQFGFEVKVLLRTIDDIRAIIKKLPSSWQDNKTMKCDVMFLWEHVASPKVMEMIQAKPEFEKVVYVPGAILWCVPREYVTKSGMLKIIGTDLYKQMTIRNCNTVRKLFDLMQSTI